MDIPFRLKIPNRTEPEINLLSVIVDDGRRLLDVIDIVKAEDFSLPCFQSAWRWFLTLLGDGVRISRYALKQRYGTTPEWDAFSGFLLGLEDGIMPFMTKDYARDVNAHARRVRAQVAISRLNILADAATTPEEIEDGVRDLFEQTCSEVVTKSARKADAIVKEIEHDLDHPTTVPRFPTGFAKLDEKLKGGLKPGQLVIIAARTGGGKTVMAMNIAVHVGKAGTPVVAFSLEMSDRDLVMRCLLSESPGNSLTETYDTVRGLPLYVDDSSNITVRSVAAKIKLLASRYRAKVFIVDYLQLLGSEGGSRDTRERIVADMSRTLKIAAKETGVAIVALSQVNADGELRESRAVEQDADVVLHVIDLLEQVPDPSKKGATMDGDRYEFFLRVTKQRGGEAHGPITRASKGAPGIPLRFDAPNFKFTEK